MYRVLFALLAALLLLTSVSAQEAALANPAECVTDYDAEVDYFPAKAEVEFAEGFTVEYFLNYKVVTVTRPFPGAGELMTDIFTEEADEFAACRR